MGFYNFKIEDTISIQKEFTEITDKLKDDISDVLNRMSIYLISKLQNHINEDFYNKYTPKFYKRRKNFPQYGIPLPSEDYMETSVSDQRLTLEYLPDNRYRGRMTLEGDNFINLLQTGTKRGMKGRAFWKLFIEDISKDFELEFVSEMQAKGYNIKASGNFSVDSSDEI